MTKTVLGDDDVVVCRFLPISQPISSSQSSEWPDAYVELKMEKDFTPDQELRPIVGVTFFPDCASPIVRDQICLEAVAAKLIRVLGVRVSMDVKQPARQDMGILHVIAGAKSWSELRQRLSPTDPDAVRVIRDLFHLA